MNRQSGNVFFIIFLGIALFAALAYVVSNGIRSGDNSGFSSEKAKVSATEVLSYGNALQTAVRTVMINNGCLETQLNFYSDADTSFSTAAAPADKSCNIFDLNGGGVFYLKVNSNWLDDSFSAKTDYGNWLFMAKSCIYGMGKGGVSTCDPTISELIAYLPFVKQEVCVAYNKAMDVNAPTYAPESNLLTAVKFSGTYSAGAGSFEAFAPSLSGKRAGCFKVSSGGNYNSAYTLYYVLLPR